MKLTLSQYMNRSRLNEAKLEYDDSAEFTEELMNARQHITNLTRITFSPRWAKWMKATDENYATNCAKKANELNMAVRAAKHALAELEEELFSAE